MVVVRQLVSRLMYVYMQMHECDDHGECGGQHRPGHERRTGGSNKCERGGRVGHAMSWKGTAASQACRSLLLVLLLSATRAWDYMGLLPSF